MGIRGKNDRGDIAIDDISFTETNCGVQPVEVLQELSTLTTLPPVTTPQMPASFEISCNFDANNTCGWTDDPTSELKWTVHKGQTSSTDTGPTSDVSGDGFYIYLETSDGKKGEKARIISQKINDTLAKQTSSFNKLIRTKNNKFKSLKFYF